MEDTTLLKPTIHVEVLLKSKVSVEVSQQIATDIREALIGRYKVLTVNSRIDAYDSIYASHIEACFIVDFTGPQSATGVHRVQETQLDVQTYSLHTVHASGVPRRRISQSGGADDDVPQARVLALPNVSLTGEWDSLVYDDGLPARILRYLTRMLGVMRQPNLNLSTFNWNRLVLLHGPPGSGKSTLCRALAQKLSIRLSASFPQAVLVEVNTSAMLSKYFGESGKLIGKLFENINGLAQSSTTLVCVVIDEVETIAGSRQKATDGGECSDGLRATNQLLTALDKIRALPNIIILCTSNLISAMDSAFLDRVDIKQLIPSPSPAAIYNIFRSCLNELVHSRIVDTATRAPPTTSPFDSDPLPLSSPSFPPERRTWGQSQRQGGNPPPFSLKQPSDWSLLEGIDSSSTVKSLSGGSTTALRMNSKTSGKRKRTSSAKTSQSVDIPEIAGKPSSPRDEVEQPAIPTYIGLQMLRNAKSDLSYGGRVWALAEKCVGFSGRTLRRLPILGLAMYTWGGECSLHDAISALESAVEQELKAKSE